MKTILNHVYYDFEIAFLEHILKSIIITKTNMGTNLKETNFREYIVKTSKFKPKQLE